MTKELLQENKTQLARAIAQGKSAALWARDNHVPRSTAYRWAGQPEVRATAESCRRRARNFALARMARQAYWESYRIAKLARVAESEPVKLRALRSILSDAAAVSKLSHLKRRMAAIKEKLHKQADNARPSCPAVPCSLVNTRIKNSKKAPLCLTFPQAQDAVEHGEHDPHLLPLL
jgi:hypothetical protein